MPDLKMALTKQQFKLLQKGSYLSKEFKDVLNAGDCFIVIIGKGLWRRKARKEMEKLTPKGNVLPCSCGNKHIRAMRKKTITFKFPDKIQVHVGIGK